MHHAFENEAELQKLIDDCALSQNECDVIAYIDYFSYKYKHRHFATSRGYGIDGSNKASLIDVALPNASLFEKAKLYSLMS